MARKGDVEILCSSIFYRGIPSAEILISYAVPQVSWHLDLILPLAARCSFGILPKSFSGFCHDASEASSSQPSSNGRLDSPNCLFDLGFRVYVYSRQSQSENYYRHLKPSTGPQGPFGMVLFPASLSSRHPSRRVPACHASTWPDIERIRPRRGVLDVRRSFSDTELWCHRRTL